MNIKKEFEIYKDETYFTKVHKKSKISNYKINIGDIIKFKTDAGSLYTVVTNIMEQFVTVILLTDFIELKTANDSRVFINCIEDEMLIQYDIKRNISYQNLFNYGTKVGSLNKLDIYDMKMTIHLFQFHFELNNNLQKEFKSYENARITKLFYLMEKKDGC